MTQLDVVYVRDSFTDDRRRGRVLGSRSRDGSVRTGNDEHRSFAVDHGALRITSLRDPGFGTTALSYGPYPVEPGLAFGVLLLNGHNSAQHEPLGESLRQRFKRWAKGNETQSRNRHLISWVLRGRRRWAIRRFRHWIAIDRQTRGGTLQRLDENLSVGFLPGPSSVDPIGRGHGFVMHAAGATNGELRVMDRPGVRRMLPGIQNVPLYLLVLIRETDVIHYAGSIDGVRQLPALPEVRPLAIVPLDASSEIYSSVQQAVSGQIGFAADTRIWDSFTARLHHWSTSIARPIIDPVLSDMVPGDRRTWTIPGGAGLIRILASDQVCLEIGFRHASDAGGWSLRLCAGAVSLFHHDGEEAQPIASQALVRTDRPLDVQIADNGRSFCTHVNGELQFDRWIEDDRHGSEDGLTVTLVAGNLDRLEVHRRQVPLPSNVRPEPLLSACDGADRRIVAADDFAGPPGDLEKRARADGANWRRTIGSGRILRTGSGAAQVEASTAKPLGGRTAYMITSPAIGLADGPIELEIDVCPPGTGRGQGERSRAGVFFSQDSHNALFVSTWLDDHYDGASISSFFTLGGYEDLYDAIWTNVGERISWGRPYRLRVTFDGLVYTAAVDDELVLYRSLTDVHPRQSRLDISGVGIVANWEWGTDTGSVFRRFEARVLSPGS